MESLDNFVFKRILENKTSQRGACMQDHSCCVVLFAASIVAIGAVIAYFNSKLSFFRRKTKK